MSSGISRESGGREGEGGASRVRGQDITEGYRQTGVSSKGNRSVGRVGRGKGRG